MALLSKAKGEDHLLQLSDSSFFILPQLSNFRLKLPARTKNENRQYLV